jgi:hypothetical protein
MLKSKLDDLRSELRTADTPFGVDLALPPVGGTARKTNKDYAVSLKVLKGALRLDTVLLKEGKLDQLIDIIIEAKPVLFVCALGGPLS